MLNLQRISVVGARKLFRRATYSGNTLRSSTNMAETATATTNITKQRAATKSNLGDIEISKEEEIKEELQSKSLKGSSGLVAAAFDNLKNAKSTSNPAPSPTRLIDEYITNATTVNNLLVLAEGNSALTRKHALRIVSILADWTSIKRVKLAAFENDARFLRICRMLGRTPPKEESNKVDGGPTHTKVSGFRTDDLNTVLGVTGDDEAAKLIASISLPQMVKVMSTLANRKRRSTPLLRSLAFNMSSTTETLDLKSIADVFYAMSTLNFQDSVLAAKLCTDMQAGLPKNYNKSAVIGSILTSLGLLKYRDLDIMEALTQWILNHRNICRPQDLSALFRTSAILNFKSTQLAEVRKLGNILEQQDFIRSCDWLTHVWSLAMMGISDNTHLESVLSTAFIEKLQSEPLTASTQMKVLNLNSYAQLMATNYKGPFLTKDSKMFDVPLLYSKTTQILVNAMLDALKSFLPSTNHVITSCNSQMGFLIDAYCLFDNKYNSLPLNTIDNKQGIKVALMVVDYHDVCQGVHKAVSGITELCFDLLEKSGYRVLPVYYNEFSASDKLLKRVQYLESKLKLIIDNSLNNNTLHEEK